MLIAGNKRHCLICDASCPPFQFPHALPTEHTGRVPPCGSPAGEKAEEVEGKGRGQRAAGRAGPEPTAINGTALLS